MSESIGVNGKVVVTTLNWIEKKHQLATWRLGPRQPIRRLRGGEVMNLYHGEIGINTLIIRIHTVMYYSLVSPLLSVNQQTIVQKTTFLSTIPFVDSS